jgi:histone-lysine N-methyltransferase SETMAR
MFAAGVLILHGKVRPHASVAVSEILEKCGWQVLPHPSYSPDMSPPYFDLFPKLKKPLRGKCIRGTEEVSNEVTRVIKTHQQQRRPDRNARVAQTLDHCD